MVRNSTQIKDMLSRTVAKQKEVNVTTVQDFEEPDNDSDDINPSILDDMETLSRS